MADVAHQGASSILNEDVLGNDRKSCRWLYLRLATDKHTASWLDHSRDLLHLVNVKRDEMPRPIVGIGHSFGGAQLFVPP